MSFNKLETPCTADSQSREVDHVELLSKCSNQETMSVTNKHFFVIEKKKSSYK